MKKVFISSFKESVLSKILFPLAIFSCIYIVANLIYYSWSSERSLRSDLKNTTRVVSETISYKEGLWDVSAYVNSKISHSGPLYVITIDGFVIDKKNMINGFLDISDYRFSSSFQTPQIITTPVGQRWQLFSQPIFKDNTVVGVITTGYAQPEFSSIEEVDAQLKYAAYEILSQTAVSQTGIDVSKVDGTKVSNKIAFEVVDKFNKTLLRKDNLPSYIDRSYVAKHLKQGFQTIEDEKTKEPYLVYFYPMYKSSSQPVGLVISGYSLKQIRENLYKHVAFSLTAGIVVTGIMIVSARWLLGKDVLPLVTVSKKEKTPTLLFNKSDSVIIFGDKRLKLPYDSNQYHVCKVLFSNPKKRWEYDEILEKGFGIDIFEEVKKNWRKVYDAVRAVNEKSREVFGFETIMFEAKTFQISPDISARKIESN